MADFFRTLRDDFPDYLDDAARRNPELPLWHRLADVGFALASTASMDFADSNYISSALRRFPSGAPEQAFVALAMGVLMGRLEEQEISEIDMICRQDDLQEFVRENRDLLEARFGEARV